MKAIILAAGRGKRMKSLTDQRPKCLIELHGKALLDRQIQVLKQAGINEIGIVTGYKREMLSDRGLVEFHNPRWSETNMVISLACASTWLEKYPCIVSYSDIFYEHTAVKALINCNANLALTYDINWLELWKKRFTNPLSDAETFRIDSNGNLLEIGQKPQTLDEIQGQYMGLLYFTPIAWKEVTMILESLPQKESDKLYMTDILQKIVKTHCMNIKTLPYTGQWGELDNEKDLEIYSKRQLF